MWAYLAFSRSGGEGRTVLLSVDTQETIFASRFQRGPGAVVCIAGFVGISSTAAAVSADVITTAGRGWSSVCWGPLSPSTRWSRPAVTFDEQTCGYTSSPDQFALDEDTLVSAVFPIGRIYRTDLPASRTVRIATRDDVGGAPTDPILAGDAVFVFEDRAGRVDEWVIPRGDVPTPFIRRLDRDVSAFQADISFMAWMEGMRAVPRDGGLYSEITSWSSPLVLDERSVRPRRLGRLPTSNLAPEPTLAFGRYAYFETWTRVRVVNLADGTSWAIDCEPAYHWSIPVVWMGPDEIALGIREPFESPGYVAITIRRIRFDSLGAPEPLPP